MIKHILMTIVTTKVIYFESLLIKILVEFST